MVLYKFIYLGPIELTIIFWIIIHFSKENDFLRLFFLSNKYKFIYLGPIEIIINFSIPVLYKFINFTKNIIILQKLPGLTSFLY
ncbi:hypothetical protein ACJX0J_031302, partial [Zea mays]